MNRKTWGCMCGCDSYIDIYTFDDNEKWMAVTAYEQGESLWHRIKLALSVLRGESVFRHEVILTKEMIAEIHKELCEKSN